MAPIDRQSARYCLPKMRHGEETDEHAMGECPQIHHTATQLPEPYPHYDQPPQGLGVVGAVEGKT